ncbi:MAG: response regulator [Pseudomonadota bacterium]
MNNYTAYIIDDNYNDRYLLRRDLDNMEFFSLIFEAENGQDAMDFLLSYEQNKYKYAKRFPPIFIFLDINMPIVNGFDFLNAFDALQKKDDRYQNIMFMMFTSSSLDEEIEKSFSYNFVKEYLVKGEIDMGELKEKITHYLH